MNTTTLDTHQYIKKLVDTGFTEQQAEGIVEIFQDSDLTTKKDLELFDQRQDTRFAIQDKTFYKALLVHGAVMSGLILTALSIG